jgi:hypothetical protein
LQQQAPALADLQVFGAFLVYPYRHPANLQLLLHLLRAFSHESAKVEVLCKSRLGLCTGASTAAAAAAAAGRGAQAACGTAIKAAGVSKPRQAGPPAAILLQRCTHHETAEREAVAVLTVEGSLAAVVALAAAAAVVTSSPRSLTGPDFPFFFAEVTGLLRCRLARLRTRGAITNAPDGSSQGSDRSNWLCITAPVAVGGAA